MRRSTVFLVSGSLLLLAACSSRTVVVQQPPPVRQPRGSRPPPHAPIGPEAPPPVQPPVERRNEVLIPPGHLPDPGQCRVWIPGTPPGRQPPPRSRACAGIEASAPAGSWIVYRRADDRRLLYIRLVDERRPGIVIRNRIFDLDSWDLIREEDQREDRRGDDRPGQERPRDDRPSDNRPPVQPPPAQPPPVVQPPGNRPPEPKPPEPRPPEQRPADRPVPPPEIIRPVQPDSGRQQPPPPVQPPVNPPPAEPPPAPVSEVTLKIPPGHLPDLGECRVWRPLVPPGLQSKPKSRSCTGINSVAAAGTWILYRPKSEPKVLHVRIVDERRAGVVVKIQVFDLDSKRLLREETP